MPNLSIKHRCARQIRDFQAFPEGSGDIAYEDGVGGRVGGGGTMNSCHLKFLKPKPKQNLKEVSSPEFLTVRLQRTSTPVFGGMECTLQPGVPTFLWENGGCRLSSESTCSGPLFLLQGKQQNYEAQSCRLRGHERRDELPKERRLLLSDTFLAFYLREMPGGQKFQENAYT